MKVRVNFTNVIIFGTDFKAIMEQEKIEWDVSVAMAFVNCIQLAKVLAQLHVQLRVSLLLKSHYQVYCT